MAAREQEDQIVEFANHLSVLRCADLAGALCLSLLARVLRSIISTEDMQFGDYSVIVH